MSLSQRMRVMRELPHINKHLGSPVSAQMPPRVPNAYQETSPEPTQGSLAPFQNTNQVRPAYRQEASAPGLMRSAPSQQHTPSVSMYTPSVSTNAENSVTYPPVYRRVYNRAILLLDRETGVQRASVMPGMWIVTAAHVVNNQLLVFHVDEVGEMHELMLQINSGGRLQDFFDRHTLLLSDTTEDESG